jgi:RimJ/RimL family protein N-acetyltransferase
VTTIETLGPEGFPLVARWLSNPELNGWLTSEWRGRSVDPAVVALACRNRRNHLYLVRLDGAPVGLVALADIDPADRCAMIWYALGERGQGGRGIISDAVNAVCRLAFAELGLACVYAWIMRPNEGSRRVLVHNGFREIGAMRAATTCQGASVDRIYFDLTPEDLPPARVAP